jgi:glycosyltransferase involved in cell wall biosynthesis
VRVAFVYPNSRRGLLEKVAAGEAPDTALLGLNHLGEHGIEAVVHEPRLATRGGRIGHRLTWNARELLLPWELRHADLVCTPLATLFPLAARTLRRPRVLLLSWGLCSTFDRLGVARRRLLRAAVRSAAAVACSSAAGGECLRGRTGVAPRTATLGVDASWWFPSALPADGYVLSVGRDLARDYGTLFAAVRELPVRVVVAAKAENVRGLLVPSNVEVRFDVSLQEVRTLYAGARCVVVPVRGEAHAEGTESSGTIAMLEAMASGRPVVVTERSFLRDYVEAGRTGLCARAEDPGALRSQIERLLADPELGQTLAHEARREVEARHTTRHLAARLAAIMGDVMHA